MKNSLLRYFLLLVTYPFYWRYLRSLKNVQNSQRVLKDEIESEIKSIERFKDLSEGWNEVPLSEYSDYEPWIEKEKSGLKRQSISEPVINFEKTSGSSGKNKYIPYSKKSMLGFSKMFLIWLHDLLRSDLKLRNLKTYISISPNFQTEEAVARARVGLESDDEYLPGWLRFFLKDYLVAPPGLKKIKDPKKFKIALLASLVAEKDLEIISIWNPSFMLILLKGLPIYWDEIKDSIKRNDLGAQLPELQVIWPNLKLISLWGDANAKEDFEKLKALFPYVYFQKKGLLSTEFPATIPLMGSQFGLPLPHLIYYEFKLNNQIVSLADVQEGLTYELILSQPGGFIRYRTHDAVLVREKHLGVPSLEFVGRNNLVSDMVGEKLNEQFVKAILQEELGVNFAFLLAVREEDEKYYKVISTRALLLTDLQNIEQRLRANIHYDYARNLGQLSPLQSDIVTDVQSVYYQLMEESGMKIGDIKLSYLVNRTLGQTK